jgi:hypothetical protein
MRLVDLLVDGMVGLTRVDRLKFVEVVECQGVGLKGTKGSV